jgi:hypothetical protein
MLPHQERRTTDPVPNAQGMRGCSDILVLNITFVAMPSYFTFSEMGTT